MTDYEYERMADDREDDLQQAANERAAAHQAALHPLDPENDSHWDDEGDDQ